ncbi:hypothetical protein [Modestobacter excelsi]|uniref:hypothetical protein n=1 Tax=Modestobacter excelsi TaxID=2213161 RepID=UPI00110CD88F|nr:hypothetical protein [Modestobacter excelsi]
MPGGFSPPPGPAEAGVETQRSEGSAVAALARGVLVPALVATLIGLAFVVVFLDAFHAAVPHDLPVGVVGSAAQVDQVRTALDRAAPGEFAVARLTDEAAARAAVLQRDVYAAFLPGPPARLLSAGANGQGVTMTVTQAFSPLAQQAGGQLQAEDLRPLAPGDTRGLGIFYGSFGVVLGGFLFGIQSYSAVHRVGRHLRHLAGPVVLGNATSTGNLPAEYLPPWLHPLAEVLPPGVAVRALRGATYFDGDGVTRALWVLGLWSVVPLALIALLDAVRRRQARPTSA